MRRSVNNNLSSSINRTMLRRTLFLMAVCGIVSFLVLAARLYVLQIKDHDKYEQLAISQQLRETGSSARRGTIYDCNMNILAMSANVENVYLSPAEIGMYKEDLSLSPTGFPRYSDLTARISSKKPKTAARGM